MLGIHLPASRQRHSGKAHSDDFATGERLSRESRVLYPRLRMDSRRSHFQARRPGRGLFRQVLREIYNYVLGNQFNLQGRRRQCLQVAPASGLPVVDLVQRCPVQCSVQPRVLQILTRPGALPSEVEEESQVDGVRREVRAPAGGDAVARADVSIAQGAETAHEIHSREDADADSRLCGKAQLQPVPAEAAGRVCSHVQGDSLPQRNDVQAGVRCHSHHAPSAVEGV